MNKSEYITTLKGMLSRSDYQKIFKEIFLIINAEPKSKKSIKSEERLDFKKNIFDYLISRKKASFRKDVFLSLYFRASSKNCPELHTLAKNYLDLLESPLKGTKKRNKSGLYYNDRQVKCLSVSFDISPKLSPSIVIKCSAMRDTLNELSIFKNLLNNSVLSDNQIQNESLKQLRNDDINFNQRIEEKFEDLEQLIEESLYDDFGRDRHWYQDYEEIVKDIQDLYLKQESIWLVNQLANIPLLFKDPKDYKNPIESSLALTRRKMLLEHSIKLSRLPVKTGDTKKIQSEIKQKLVKLVSNRKMLFPLRTQLSVFVFFISPKNSSIDLDNLARKLIVPIVHEVLKPPLSQFYINEKIAKAFPELLHGSQNKTQKSLTNYTILELPRMSHDPEEGQLNIVLSEGGLDSCLFDSIEKIIRETMTEIGL